MSLNRAPETLPITDYLVVQHPSDRLSTSPGRLAMQLSMSLNPVGSNTSSSHPKATVLVSVSFLE